MVLETERLILREMTVEDSENIYRLNLDPEVIKYTGDKSFSGIEEAKLFLQNYTHYQEFGFGRWAVINKEDLNFLGWCGLKYSPETNEVDIGFRLFKEFWNKGYATESAKACLQVGFEKFGISSIVGRARQENIESIKVLEKIGLAYFKSFDFDGYPGVIYKIDSPEKAVIDLKEDK